MRKQPTIYSCHPPWGLVCLFTVITLRYGVSHGGPQSRYVTLSSPSYLGEISRILLQTGTPADGEAERAARAKGSRLACIKVVLQDCGAWTHLIVLLFCATRSVTWPGAALKDFFSAKTAHQVALVYVTGIACPPIHFLWVALAEAAWVPVS